MKKITSLAIAATLIFSACSIQKRHYMAGYHMEWNKDKTETVAIEKNNKTSKVL